MEKQSNRVSHDLRDARGRKAHVNDLVKTAKGLATITLIGHGPSGQPRGCCRYLGEKSLSQGGLPFGILRNKDFLLFDGQQALELEVAA